MFSTLLTIFPVFLIIIAGYSAGRFGVVPTDSAQAISKMVIWVMVPALMFRIVATADWHAIWDGSFAISSLLGSCILFAAGLAIGRLRGLNTVDMAIDGLNASYSNAAFLGLPILAIAIGPQTSPYVLFAATATLAGLFCIAVILAEMASGREDGHGFYRAVLKALSSVARNPLLVSPALGLLWWTTGWKLPQAADRFLEMAGNAASPTALIGIGLLLAQRSLWQAMANRFVLALSFLKLVVHPLVTAVIAVPILHMPRTLALTAILIAAMPIGTGPFMMTGMYARDGSVTSGTILVSTMMSVFTITLILTFFPL